MIASGADGSLGTWSAPECPFTIEYDQAVLEDIRLAVVDAFYSLPRGGAEIGGILLGAHSEDRVVIDGYVPVECEHAYGPSFTLSPNDQARLKDAMHSTPGGGTDVVGWYHSHTRSEIFLSDADLEIHNKFFGGSRQVAIVVKPSTFDPVRCGFFFRDAEGGIRAESSWREFSLAPAVARPAPAQPAYGAPVAREVSEPAAAPQASGASRRPLLTLDSVLKAGSASTLIEVRPAAAESVPVSEPDPPAAVATAAPAVAEPVAAAPAAEPVATPVVAVETEPARTNAGDAGGETVTESNAPEPEPPILSAAIPAQRSYAGLYWMAVSILVGVLAYQTSDWWMGTAGRTPASAAAPKAPALPQETAVRLAPPAIGLALSESNGNLQVRWDRAAPAVHGAARGVIEINDGKDKAVVPLDRARLAAGGFVYVRQTESVDVRLALELEGGGRVQEVATFLGRMPAPQAGAAEPAGEREELTQEAARLRADLKAQTERARKLQRSLEDARRQLKRDEQRRRLENQASEAVR